jgi:magnesium chelatase family protein
VERYRARVSGPLLDRFDMHIALRPVEARALREGEQGERSAEVRARVEQARARALGRSRREREERSGRADDVASAATAEALLLLDRAVDALGLSVRGYVKALRVSRTIADLDGCDRVEAQHMAEAVQYRLLDRRPRAARPLAVNG